MAAVLPLRTQARRCSQELADVPFQAFRLPTDGRKWQAMCMTRRAVLQRLAIAANQNGKSICLSAPRIAAGIGISRPTVFRVLQDLRALGFLADDGEWHPKYHTRMRSLDLSQVLETANLTTWNRLRFAPQPSHIHFEPSQIAPDPTVDLTEDPTENRKQGCTGVQPRSVSTSSGKSKSKPVRSSRCPIPTENWDALLRHIQGPDFAEVEWRRIRRDRAALRSLWALVPDVEAIRDALDAALAHGATCAETLFSIATELLDRVSCGTRSQRGTA